MYIVMFTVQLMNIILKNVIEKIKKNLINSDRENSYTVWSNNPGDDK